MYDFRKIRGVRVLLSIEYDVMTVFRRFSADPFRCPAVPVAQKSPFPRRDLAREESVAEMTSHIQIPS